SLKIVGGYRPNVRKLSSWMEDCLADYACGRYRIASSLETSGRRGRRDSGRAPHNEPGAVC
ncbi:hypothetical protein NX871_07795, partial [Burkholderia thailandensis]|nr:hypothetical protein [Burkholderia thailandensis]